MFGYVMRYRNGGMDVAAYREGRFVEGPTKFVEYGYNLLEGWIDITSRDESGGPGCYQCLQGVECRRSEGCPDHYTRAQSETMRVTLPVTRLPSLADAACQSIIPFADRD